MSTADTDTKSTSGKRGGARPGTGGARPGAGRPRKDTPGTEARQVSLPVETWALLDRIVAESNAADPENATTPNKWIAGMIRNELMRRKYQGRGEAAAEVSE